MISAPIFVLFVVFYLMINGVVFFFYTHDKIKAKKNARRTPETRLLFFAIFGPLGACAAMLGFRHKTRKMKFYLVPLYAMLHIVLLIWMLLFFIE